ncbi:MAG: type II secretion system F family protein [Planctomycetaceae bacterium]|nr:type II secretion system F family protein [Planctomycetaceae bacterium]
MIRVNELAGWCRRVAISLNAGLDILRVLEREAGRFEGDITITPPDRRKPVKEASDDLPPEPGNTAYDYRKSMRLRQQAADARKAARPKGVPAFLYTNPKALWRYVADRVRQGTSLHEAFSEIEEHFPKLFVPMIGVGEKSGSLGETLGELARYYEYQLNQKREFWRAMFYPILQLCAVVFVLSAVIFIMGFINSLSENKVDILGFGLSGGTGVLWFWFYLFMISIPFFTAYYFIKHRITRGGGILQHLLNRIPKIGGALRCFAMARFAWALHMTLKTGMDVREALKLSFDVAAYAPITDHLSGVLKKIGRGTSIADAIPRTETMDHEFLMYVKTGEQAGELPESMARLAAEYLERAKYYMKQVSVAFGFLVFFLVSAIVIFFIFRIASFYVGIINDALRGV